jgi:hypothetical protein
MSGFCRIIAGVSGSPRNLQALRYAAVLARGQDAALIPVLAWVPPGGDLADRRRPSAYLRRRAQECRATSRTTHQAELPERHPGLALRMMARLRTVIPHSPASR